jgi:hypothetical protein
MAASGFASPRLLGLRSARAIPNQQGCRDIPIRFTPLLRRIAQRAPGRAHCVARAPCRSCRLTYFGVMCTRKLRREFVAINN